MKKIKTIELENSLRHASKDDLELILDSYQETEFTLEFERLLTVKNMTKSDLIKKTTLDRNYAYQIIQGSKNASKNKIIQFCIALQCSLEESNRLLTLSDNSSLYAKQKRDALLIVAIEKQYTVMETNDLLNQFELEIL